MIVPQQKLLYAIVVDGAYSLLNSVKTEWMTDEPHRLALRGVIETILDKKSSSLDDVVMTLNGGQLRDWEKSKAIAALKLAVKDPDGWDSTLPNELADNYRKFVYSNLKDALTKDNTDTEIMTAVEDAYQCLRGTSKKEDGVTAHEVMTEHLRRIESGEKTLIAENTVQIRDRVLASMFPGGNFYPAPHCIMAREKFHKTQMLCNIAVEMTQQGKCGVVYNFENSSEVFSSKYAAVRSMIEYNKIIMGQLDPEDVKRLKVIYERQKEKKLIIKDHRMTVEEWARDVRGECLKRQIDWIGIDFLQRFKGLGRNIGDQSVLLSIATKEIADISKEFLIPIFYLTQVNENMEDKQTGEVVLTIGNAKGSGSIKEDARIVAAIDGVPSSKTKNWKILKNEYGPLYTKTFEINGANGVLLNAHSE